MNTLKYKRARFTSFGVRDEITGEEFYEYSDMRELPYEGMAWTYVCPECIKHFCLEGEAGMSYEGVDDIYGWDADESVCCVEGCDYTNAIEVEFDTRRCGLENFFYEYV